MQNYYHYNLSCTLYQTGGLKLRELNIKPTVKETCFGKRMRHADLGNTFTTLNLIHYFSHHKQY